MFKSKPGFQNLKAGFLFFQIIGANENASLILEV